MKNYCHSYLKIFFTFIIAWNQGSEVVASLVNLTTACNDNSWYHHCTLTKLTSSLDDPLIIVKSNITEAAAAAAAPPDLIEIILRNSNLPRVPSEIFQLLPNLEIFFMHRCALKRIQTNDFSGATKLKILILQNNRLSELPEEVFTAAVHLEEIRLTNNHILQIHRKAFVGLKQLRVLDLAVNNIHELFSDGFAPLVNLEFIDLSHNAIQKIDNQTFAANLKLRTIILSDNKFVAFASDSLNHLPHLFLLDVSFSKIDEIRLQTVDTLLVQGSELRRCVIDGSVIRLRANNNLLEGITITDKNSVKEIEVHGNLFVSLNDFVGMRNLQKLDISRNQLKSLSTKESPTFLPLANLNHLNIAGNQIQDISADNFLYLTKLTHLDIAFNRMIYLDEWIFEPLRSLEKLYIEGNRLHEFGYENFTRSHSLIREMGIFSNDWEFAYLREMVAHLKAKGIHLPVRYNPSESIHSSSSGPSLTTPAHHHTVEYMDVPINSDEISNPTSQNWTTRDILTVTILCFVLFILLLQFYKVAKEESCFTRFQRTFHSRNVPSRLSEEDSQV